MPSPSSARRWRGRSAGYLTKGANARELCDAISAVTRGGTVLSSELQAGVSERSAAVAEAMRRGLLE